MVHSLGRLERRENRNQRERKRPVYPVLEELVGVKCVKDKSLIKVEITFVLSGALVGILFVWLVSVPTTVDFWFIRGNQFLIPRVQY